MIMRLAEIEANETKNPRGGTGTALMFPYVAATGLTGEITMFSVVDLEPGASVGFHTHDDDNEIYLVLDGTPAADDNGEKSTLNPGDMMVTKKGEGHALVNETDAHVTFLGIIVA